MTTPYTPVTPVNLAGGDPIIVTLTYDSAAQTLREVLADPTAGTSETIMSD